MARCPISVHTLAVMRFVVFDLEANADHPHPESQEIIEIGAVMVSDGEVVGEFASLISPTPGRPLASLTIELTGLTDQILRGAPPREPTLERFLAFCGDLPLVAHNGSTYDFPLLMAELHRAGLPEPLGERLDTLELAHVVFPEPERSPFPTFREGCLPGHAGWSTWRLTTAWGRALAPPTGHCRMPRWYGG